MDIRLDPPATARREDVPEIANLLGQVFARDRDWGVEVPWQYLNNPCGPARYVNARAAEGRLLGHYAVIPIPRIQDQRFRGIRTFLSLNTAVHPDAQGRGVFKQTATALYASLQAEGPSAVLGVGNAQSVRGLVGALRFAPLGQLDLRLYFPWQRPRTSLPRLLESGPEYLRWRSTRPGCQHRLVPGEGTLSRLMRHRGVPIEALLSVALGPSDLQSAVSTTTAPARRWWVPRLYASSERLRGGVPIPSRFRPSPLHFVCRPLLADDPAPLLAHVGRSLFEFLDFDVV